MRGPNPRIVKHGAAALLVAVFGLGTSLHAAHHLSPSSTSSFHCFACQVRHAGAVQATPVPLPIVESRPAIALPEPSSVRATPQHRLPEPRGPPSV